MAAAAQEIAGLPDMKVSVRQVFGIDSDMEVPAYSEPDDHVPDVDQDYRFDRATTLLPVLARFREILWLKAAIRGVTSAVIGILVVSLSRLAPHAIPDLYTAIILAATVAAMLATRFGPVSLMAAGAAAGLLLNL